jgi:colicin import membrane protein
MTTTIPATPATAEDSFPHGWRYVKRVAPNGVETIDQIPLTLDDVLHPREGDQVTESEVHERRRRYLAYVLAAHLADDAGAVVLSDVLIAWDVPGIRPMALDIAVVFGVRARKPWGTFDVAEEGVLPRLVIELTSPKTALLD